MKNMIGCCGLNYSKCGAPGNFEHRNKDWGHVTCSIPLSLVVADHDIGGTG